MFIAGKKSSILKESRDEKLTCSNCQKKGSVNIIVLGNYKHLLQIPFVSAGKFGKSKCENCASEFTISTMSDELKLAYYELKELVKTPIWFYTGLIVIKTLVLIKIFSKYF